MLRFPISAVTHIIFLCSPIIGVTPTKERVCKVFFHVFPLISHFEVYISSRLPLRSSPVNYRFLEICYVISLSFHVGSISPRCRSFSPLCSRNLFRLHCLVAIRSTWFKCRWSKTVDFSLPLSLQHRSRCVKRQPRQLLIPGPSVLTHNSGSGLVPRKRSICHTAHSFRREILLSQS